MLKPVIHDNKSKLWCGPCTIAAITGKPTSEITAKIRDVNGKRKVTGTSRYELDRVLYQCGFSVRTEHDYSDLPMKDRPTLYQVAQELPDGVFVINTTRHWTVVSGKWCVDSASPTPTLLHYAPRRKKRVNQVIQVFKGNWWKHANKAKTA